MSLYTPMTLSGTRVVVRTKNKGSSSISLDWDSYFLDDVLLLLKLDKALFWRHLEMVDLLGLERLKSE